MMLKFLFPLLVISRVFFVETVKKKCLLLGLKTELQKDFRSLKDFGSLMRSW